MLALSELPDEIGVLAQFEGVGVHLLVQLKVVKLLCLVLNVRLFYIGLFTGTITFGGGLKLITHIIVRNAILRCLVVQIDDWQQYERIQNTNKEYL